MRESRKMLWTRRYTSLLYSRMRCVQKIIKKSFLSIIIRKFRLKNILAGWAEWAEWSCCSVTCGSTSESGHRVRTRACHGAKVGQGKFSFSYHQTFDFLKESLKKLFIPPGDCPCGGTFTAGLATNTCSAQSCENSVIRPQNDAGYFQTEVCKPANECREYYKKWKLI